MSLGQAFLTICLPSATLVSVNIEFTQLDGKKRRTAKRLCVTNVTGLLLPKLYSVASELQILERRNFVPAEEISFRENEILSCQNDISLRGNEISLRGSETSF